MDKNTVYTLYIYNKNITYIEEQLKQFFNIKFLAFDQYELKISFTNELSDSEENKLLELIK